MTMIKAEKNVDRLLDLVDEIRESSPADNTERYKLLAIIDASVVAMAVAFKGSFSEYVIQAIEEGYIIPIYDKRLLGEYFNVLDNPRFTALLNRSRNLGRHSAVCTIVKNGVLVDDIQQADDRLTCPCWDVDDFIGIVKEDEDHFTMTPKRALNRIVFSFAGVHFTYEEHEAYIERCINLIQGKPNEKCDNCRLSSKLCVTEAST